MNSQTNKHLSKSTVLAIAIAIATMTISPSSRDTLTPNASFKALLLAEKIV